MLPCHLIHTGRLTGSNGWGALLSGISIHSRRKTAPSLERIGRMDSTPNQIAVLGEMLLLAVLICFENSILPMPIHIQLGVVF